MKKILLILMLCLSANAAQRIWNGGSTDMNLATNYSGSGALLTTDTLVFNGTSVVNATATASLNVSHISIESTYSGAWTISGYTATINNGGIKFAGSGTANWGNGITLNGNGSIKIEASAGTQSTTSCVITANGLHDTINSNRAISTSRHIINGELYYTGTGIVGPWTYGTTPYTIGPNGNLAGDLSPFARISSTCSVISISSGGLITNTKMMIFEARNSSGSITATVPKIKKLGDLSFLTMGAGTATFYVSDTLDVGELRVYCGSTGGNLTLSADNKFIRSSKLNIGSSKSGSYANINLTNSTLLFEDANTSQFQTDSSIIDFTGSTLTIYNDWLHGTKERITGGTFTSVFTDLVMGHSMMTNLASGSPMYHYERIYRGKAFKNRAVSGYIVSQVLARVDSCLAAYTPNRFYLWIGRNDLYTYKDNLSTFAANELKFWGTFNEIISKVKESGVDSIYCVGMSPEGTIANPMSDNAVTNYKNFNSHMQDTCIKYGLFFIPVFDSLLADGYTNVINPILTTDSLHPNRTVEGSVYTSYLFTLAQSPVVTFNQSADTLKLVCSATNALTYQWYQNDTANVGKTDSVLTIIADSAFYASKNVIYCMINGTTKSNEWIFYAQPAAGSRWWAYKRAYKQAFK